MVFQLAYPRQSACLEDLFCKASAGHFSFWNELSPFRRFPSQADIQYNAEEAARVVDEVHFTF